MLARRRMFGAGAVVLGILSGCVVVEEGGPPPIGPRPDICPQIYAPVCGARDGELQTLPNECVAESRGFRVIADGECRRQEPPISRPPPDRPQFCTQQYEPVCARDGQRIRTFGNACSARAEGAQIIYEGSCRY